MEAKGSALMTEKVLDFTSPINIGKIGNFGSLGNDFT